jgi:hypothetical protein
MIIDMTFLSPYALADNPVLVVDKTVFRFYSSSTEMQGKSDLRKRRCKRISNPELIRIVFGVVPVPV